MMMVPILSELDKLPVSYEEHPLVGHFARSINTIHAGTKTNTIPDRCVVTVDQRTVPGQDHDVIVRQVEELIADLGQRLPLRDFRASVKVINSRLPLATSPEEPVVQRFYDVVAEVTGKRPEPKGVGYYTDAVEFVPALKAPFVICGPGNPKLNHQTNEWVEVAKLMDSAKIYTLTAVELLT
jgi:succinyl-diaminopimelate desuccinylase